MKVSVIDVETTGFGRTDRLVEIAIVSLDSTTGRIVDEYDTLLNPERDVGPTGVHGIAASHVALAPTFCEVSGAIARRVDSAILVGHNLSFDTRLLGQEFDRMSCDVRMGTGFCTLARTPTEVDARVRRSGYQSYAAAQSLVGCSRDGGTRDAGGTSGIPDSERHSTCELLR